MNIFRQPDPCWENSSLLGSLVTVPCNIEFDRYRYTDTDSWRLFHTNTDNINHTDTDTQFPVCYQFFIDITLKNRLISLIPICICSCFYNLYRYYIITSIRYRVPGIGISSQTGYRYNNHQDNSLFENKHFTIRMRCLILLYVVLYEHFFGLILMLPQTVC